MAPANNGRAHTGCGPSDFQLTGLYLIEHNANHPKVLVHNSNLNSAPDLNGRLYLTATLSPPE